VVSRPRQLSAHWPWSGGLDAGIESEQWPQDPSILFSDLAASAGAQVSANAQEHFARQLAEKARVAGASGIAKPELEIEGDEGA
jgi:hypothetical protein